MLCAHLIQLLYGRHQAVHTPPGVFRILLLEQSGVAGDRLGAELLEALLGHDVKGDQPPFLKDKENGGKHRREEEEEYTRTGLSRADSGGDMKNGGVCPSCP